MKELTPRGWIRVLIEIVVFANIVGHVAATGTATGPACWPPITPAAAKTEASDIDTAFNAAPKECGVKEHCVQYQPPSSATGKFGLAIECKAASSCTTSTTTTINSVPGYTCFVCVRGGNGTGNDQPCKTDIAGIMGANGKKCPSFQSDNAKPKIGEIKHSYCVGGCQYLSSDKHNFLGCKSDCSTFNSTYASALGTAKCLDCLNEADCKKIFLPDSGASNSSNPTTSPNTGGQGGSATTKAKHSNNLNGSTWLIGSMAILLFAASEYMRQFSTGTD